MIELRRDETAKPSVLSLDFMTVASATKLAEVFVEIEPWSRYPFTMDSLTSFLSDRETDAARYVIYADGVMAGAVCVRSKWLRGNYLQFLAIVPKFQKAGLGQIVYAWFEAQARAAQVDNFWVAASNFNDGAIQFYKRLGFEQVAVIDDLIKPGIAEVLYRKRLK